MGPIHSYDQVYFVETTAKEVIGKIAIRPKIFADKVVWENTSRGKTLPIKRVKEPKELTHEAPGEIAFVDKANHVVRLSKLTLEVYNNHVKRNVAGSPDFKSDEEVQNFYLKQNFGQ